MKARTILTKNPPLRPGYGLYPKYLNEILGKKVNRDLEKGEMMRLEYVEKTLVEIEEINQK